MRRPSLSWRDLSIRRKALNVLAIPLLPLIFTAGLYLLTAAVYDLSRVATDRAWQGRVDVARLYGLVVEAESAIRGYLLGNDPALLDHHQRVRADVAEVLARLQAASPAAQARNRLPQLRALIDARLEALDAVLVSQTNSGLNSPEMMVHVARGAEAMQALRAEMDGLRQQQEELLAARAERSSVARRRVNTVVLTGAGIGLIGGLAAAFLFTTGVTRRLDVVAGNMHRLAQREPLLPVPAARDEIGRLAADAAHADRLLSERDAQLDQRMRELETLTRELEAFSYSVSHDLRAPLRHIVGFASMLEKSSSDALTDQQRRYLRTIVGAAATMGRLIDDLLAFSRTARTELQVAPVDVSTVVGDVQRRLTQELNGRAIDWIVHPLPRVSGDRALLRVVFDNLMANAVKYSRTRDRSRIEIGAQPGDRGESVIFVRDNGVGFDMQYQDKLFGVFQRLHSSDDFEGTGIGLATVRRIVTRHGGRAWAEGRPGEGATFYVALPAAEAQA